MKMHLCPDCLSTYKHSKAGKSARKTGGAWGRGKWPAHLYHSGAQRKCVKHNAQALADGAARRAGIGRATPAWADRAAIRAVYEESQRLTVETGIRHEVDHIVPLKGKQVSGLHIAANLRPIPHYQNRKKSNKFTAG